MLRGILRHSGVISRWTTEALSNSVPKCLVGARELRPYDGRCARSGGRIGGKNLKKRKWIPEGDSLYCDEQFLRQLHWRSDGSFFPCQTLHFQSLSEGDTRQNGCRGVKFFYEVLIVILDNRTLCSFLFFSINLLCHNADV